MAKLDIELIPWQEEVMKDPSRFKVIAAGRRCGKSHLAAVSLILSALDGRGGDIFYVGPTQAQARDVMWNKLFELANEIIESSNINNLEIKLVNGASIKLKGADRPDTMRGVSLKHLVMDEAAFMKADIFETILRPALSDKKGTAIFISTPEGRNNFYDMYINAQTWDDWGAWTFTTYDNPFIDKAEIEHAKSTLPGWAFRQEYVASFDSKGSEYFNAESFEYYEERPKHLPGDYYITADLAGFETERAGKTKRRDNSAIAIVFVDDTGTWWVEDVLYGRWGSQETAQKIFDAVAEWRPLKIGIEKGIAQQAVHDPLQDAMRRTHRVFRIDLLSHGNTKKQDRILWALQGRLEHGKIKFKKGDWNIKIVDEFSAFPSQLVTDDLIDALAYIDQFQIVYETDIELQDDYKPIDMIAGY